MKFKDMFEELAGLTWGNSCVDLGEDEIAYVGHDGRAYTWDRQHSISLSWSAVRLASGDVRVDVRDNSCSIDDDRCETGSTILPANN